MGKKTSNRFWHFITYFFLVINLGVVVALSFSYTAFYIDPREYWFFALFGLLYPWILLANIVFVVLWLILWKKYIWISLITVAIGWKQLTSLVAFTISTLIITPGITVKMMTFNIHGFYGPVNAEGSYRNEITEFIASEHPNIVCLQEYHLGDANPQPVVQRMAESWRLPHYCIANYYKSHSKAINGLTTFSRYPIIHHGLLEYAADKRFCLFTDLKIENDTIRVFNVHLASLHLDQDDVYFYYQLKKTNTGNVNVKKGLFNILRKLKLAFILRAKQVTILKQAIDSSPYPVIVCGDMNDSPFSYTYHQLTDDLTDSFKEAENGFLGHTYDGSLPNYRIDYIFHDDHFKAYNYTKYAIKFSDHYPVQSTLLLK